MSKYPNEFSEQNIRSAIADLRKIRAGGHVENVFFAASGVGPESVSEAEVKESLCLTWKTRWTMRASE